MAWGRVTPLGATRTARRTAAGVLPHPARLSRAWWSPAAPPARRVWSRPGAPSERRDVGAHLRPHHSRLIRGIK
eukprot:5372527-Pyramimonas_sp.AAC.2